ncbi:MAG: hypothetical protein ACQEVA_13010 [Myxococcota bacterium]
MFNLSYMAPPTSVFRVFLTALFVCTCCTLTGCETSKKAERSDTVEEPSETTVDTDGIIEQAEAARDRNLEVELTFERVSSADALDISEELPEPVAGDREFLLDQLFGIDSAPAASYRVYSDLAVYDQDSKTIRYVTGSSETQTRRAIFAAVVEAIDREQFEAGSGAASWNEFLARETAKTSTVAFSLVADALTNHDKLDAEMVARRPELVTRIESIEEWVEPESEADQGSISALEREFINRESWTLAAALYRANGWSGVELAWLMPPTRSADVVQPGNWLNGEPIARWTWPQSKADPEDRAGHVGAAVTSFWLSKTVSASALRTLFAGWTSDRYQYWEADGQRPARFEWLTLWDSPGSANQVTKAFELTLRERFPDQPDAHFVVFQKGLKVGVIISDEPAEQRRARAKEILGAKVQFEAREGLPVAFVPTRSDVIAEKVSRATLEEATWSDPASGLELDMSPLEEWKVDQPSGAAVRWFARGPDGALAQLTMELHDPLGPEFGGEPYREDLREAFTRTMEGADISGISNVELPFGRTLQATVTGEFEGTPTRIRFWHFKIDDLIFTYSFQAPADAFDEHVDRAVAVIQSARRDAPTGPAADDAEGEEGIIEFEVEEN